MGYCYLIRFSQKIGNFDNSKDSAAYYLIINELEDAGLHLSFAISSNDFARLANNSSDPWHHDFALFPGM